MLHTATSMIHPIKECKLTNHMRGSSHLHKSGPIPAPDSPIPIFPTGLFGPFFRTIKTIPPIACPIAKREILRGDKPARYKAVWMADRDATRWIGWPGKPQKFTLQKTAHSSDWRGETGGPRWAGRPGRRDCDFQDSLIRIGRCSKSLKYSVYAHCIERDVMFMAAKKSELVTTVSILTRRLREGKTYDDFRRAWYHTTGFGVRGKEVEGSGNRMFSMINVFDPREVVVIGFSTTTLGQLEDALDIDVKVRGENPLDDIIEPEIGRKFCALISEDDFSAVGDIPYKPATIGGEETDMAEFGKIMQSLQGLFGAASKKRDVINEVRKKKK